ncbi:MAG: translation initiation factor IF-2 [Deltaproteobacteria bacterium RIFCSPLOWO2_02_FULL_53_8]|nr:MAG: translation initiation factor IF-2 [Deltaproteobacteria bacterium RIFCSPLOWO2_02_FULL_53_8]
MTEKEKEKESKVKVAPKAGEEAKVETRVKPSVIRRRAAPVVIPEPKVEEVAAPSEAEPVAQPVIAAAEPKPGPEMPPVPTVKAEAPRVPEAKRDAKPAVAAPKKDEKKPWGRGKPGDDKKEPRRVPSKKVREKTPEEILAELQSEELVEEKSVVPVPVESAVIESVSAPVDDHSDIIKRDIKVFEKEPEARRPFAGKKTGKSSKFSRDKRPKAGQGGAAARPMKKTEITVPKAAKRVIRIVDAISVADLSQRLGVKAGDIIKKLMSLGIMAAINQLVDVDSVSLIAQEYGYEVESVAVEEDILMEHGSEEASAEDLLSRAPVVTVMGHVDHGKTSLLDAIRKTNVVSGEAGGITQHIGAYHVHLEKGDVTFLDTPGHEAFTAMRARGARATDIVVLVVAADDGVMPQTIEAINHAKAADVPIIVAINKIDLPQADASRIRQELAGYGLVSEEWGGQNIFIEVSAKKGIKIKELLELILLQAEILELKANVKVPARGVVVEAKLDKGRGPVSTVLIQNGVLRVGDAVISGVCYGRIRAMINDWGMRVDEAGPSMPIELLGLSGVSQAGEIFAVVKDEATARQIASIRQRKMLDRDRLKTAKVSLNDLYEKINKGEVKELNLVIKADVQGSIEAVTEVLGKLSTDAVKIKVIHSAAGGINEGDVMLASASNAIVIGFNVRPEAKAAGLAERESVDVRLYTIIYNLVDDIKNAMEGMLSPIVREETLGRAEIRNILRITKVGNVAGCYVTDGKATRGAKVRLVRDNVVIFEGKLSSLKRFKDDVKEVMAGYECGMTIDGYNDIKTGDVIEMYMLKEEAAKL